uniref:Uncharacterized protein LOC113789952 n=1 Tax=Dermatophagoides pteronyssinus TaxID=6956 RepID=A0A6P6XR68_DERPT|nr:uncharacterized protein LOC113789952 [Dermatophagoides pteronyssinus]
MMMMNLMTNNNNNQQQQQQQKSIDDNVEKLTMIMDKDKSTNIRWSNSTILNENNNVHNNKSIDLSTKRLHSTSLYSISTKIIDYCRVYPNGYLADFDHHCQRYFHCAYHNGIIKIKQLTCPIGKKFDQEISICRTGIVDCDNSK